MEAELMHIQIASKWFGDIHVLGKIDIELKRDEVTVLFGPSGCGKTTLLNILSGLDDDFTGSIECDSQKIAMVFQEPRLLPWLSVRQNIELVAAPQIDVDRLLKEVGVYEQAALYAHNLSLGMKRRVSFARALSINPDVLVMDEPFVSLDTKRADSLRLMVLDLIEKRCCNALLVTHDLKEAVQLGHRILFMGNSPCDIIKEVFVELTAQERRSADAIERFYQSIL
jgi:ABC-type nitrate/sulfonate/bicarbonate transport system ATPase subunit